MPGLIAVQRCSHSQPPSMGTPWRWSCAGSPRNCCTRRCQPAVAGYSSSVGLAITVALASLLVALLVGPLLENTRTELSADIAQRRTIERAAGARRKRRFHRHCLRAGPDRDGADVDLDGGWRQAQPGTVHDAARYLRPRPF